MSTLESVLITGANGGLGKETARQLAMRPGMKKVYLGCRNPERAEAAKRDLEASTGKSIFDILLIDVTKLDSVRAAVEKLPRAVDGVVLNAGGVGGAGAGATTSDGVTGQIAVNVLGHVVLVEELLAADKVTGVVLYVGSEAARGIKSMGMKQPELKNSSADEFAAVCDGSFFGGNFDAMAAYGYAKYVGAMWMSSLSRKHPEVRFVTMSPGATTGTAAAAQLAPFKKFMFEKIAMPMMSVFGMAHGLDAGAKRFVSALTDDSYGTGMFYGGKGKTTGPVVDQATMFADLSNETFQDNANEAIHRFIS